MGSNEENLFENGFDEEDFFGSEEAEGDDETQDIKLGNEPVEPSIKPNDVVVDIPLENIEELLRATGTVSLSVHGIILTVDVRSLESLGLDPQNTGALELVAQSLEQRLTPEQVLELRKQQNFSIKKGAKFKVEEGTLLKDYNSLQVLLPDLCSKVKIEILDKEIDTDGFHHLNTVKDEFLAETGGLKRVIKNQVAAQILNDIQEIKPSDELEFYLKLISKMNDESATKIFALTNLRLIMQYALNVDNLEFKSILTKELL